MIPYGITQCYLPPGRGDFPAFTPAEAGTRFSDPEEMQGCIDLGVTRRTAVRDIRGVKGFINHTYDLYAC